jgi:hypothetical protein
MKKSKNVHDYLKSFCDRYASDLQEAINEYKESAKILSEEVSELKSQSNILRKIKEIR